MIALITLKYTQSNSVCYVKDGQAIGIGAGQQSRIHCTRLAGNKADIWWLRQCPKVMNLPFKEGIRRADRDNTIDVYISDDYEDVLAEGVWQNFFSEKPEPLTREEMTLSSHSATTSSVLTSQVLSSSHRQVVLFVMTMLSRPATSTVSQWHSPAFACSTINLWQAISKTSWSTASHSLAEALSLRRMTAR